MRIVFDTGIYVSLLWSPHSRLRQLVDVGLTQHRVLTSTALLDELADVLSRPEFRTRFEESRGEALLAWLNTAAERVPVTTRLRACADPADDFLFALAVDGRADCIVSGDRQVLALDPFRGVRAVTPRGLSEGLGLG